MTRAHAERRYIIERRVQPDRRRGLERRIIDRRLHFQWVELERRSLPQRRGWDRRSPYPRRAANERHGPQIRWVDRHPL